MPQPFDDIRTLYGHVDATLASRAPAQTAESNPCGKCFECCQYHFYLSRYEFEYVEDFLIRSTGHSPLEWITCLKATDDPRRSAPPDFDYRCPLYAEGQGCLAYEARPLACRTLGPLLPCHSKLPTWCVYTAPQVYSTSEELPCWEEYKRLLIAHHPSPPGYFRAREAEAGES
jgi:hypothetical protein